MKTSLTGAATLALLTGAMPADGHLTSTSDKRIALSNNYAGNS